MSDQRLTRRRLLAALAASGTGALAGCSYAQYRDHLTVDVPEIRDRGGTFVGRYVVDNSLPQDRRSDDDPRPYETKYEDVRFLGYGADGERVLDVSVGDLAPETDASGEFESDRFPLVITANAGDASADEDDYFVEWGAHVAGYLGRYPDGDSSPTGAPGHAWRRLRTRRLPAEPPASIDVVDELKCRHRELRRDGNRPKLDLVQGSDEWVDRELPEPTKHRRQWIRTGSSLDGDFEHQEAVSVDYETLPPVIKSSLREGRDPPWMDRERFLDVAGDITGDRYEDLDDLPPCSADHVVCRDDRGENCAAGGGRLTGSLEKYAWYGTTVDGERRGILIANDERWRPPDAEPLPACSGERQESFTIRTTDEVNRIAGLDDGKRVDPVPPEAQQYLDARSSDEAYYRTSVGTDAFERMIGSLEPEVDGRFPGCTRSHVRCVRDPKHHCGRGRRRFYYQLPEGDSVRGLVAIYEWSGGRE